MNRKRTLLAIYIAYFLDYFGYAIAFGVFGPLLLGSDYKMFPPETSAQYRNLALGSLFAIYPLVQFIAAPVFGDISDHYGRKKTFLIITIGCAFAYFLTGLAILSHHFPLLFISRFLTGFFSSSRTICMAALSDLSPDEKSRSKSYGVIATLGGLSWVISMIIGGVFSNTVSPATPFWVAATLCVFGIGTILFFFHETTLQKLPFYFDPLKGIRHIILCFQLKKLEKLYLFYFVMMMGWGINLLWLNPYTLSRFSPSHRNLFILLASTGVIWSFGSFFLNKILLKRFKTDEIVKLSSLGLFGIFILCSLMRSYYPFAVCALLASVFGALIWTNALSMISLNAPADIQGKVMGISQSFASLSFLFAPLIAGIIASLNIAYVYPMAALLILISLAILVLLSRKAERNTSALS